MKKFFRKLKDQKGEVSVEWALVAVTMAILIGVLFTKVEGGLNAAVTTINGKLSATATTP